MHSKPQPIISGGIRRVFSTKLDDCPSFLTARPEILTRSSTAPLRKGCEIFTLFPRCRLSPYVSQRCIAETIGLAVVAVFLHLFEPTQVRTGSGIYLRIAA